jgi:hypothetical protein
MSTTDSRRTDLEARRRAIADEMAAIQADADHWNRTHPDEEPIVIDLNLSAEVEAAVKLAEEHPMSDQSSTTEREPHTPGPWEVGETDGLWITGPDREEPVICDLVPRDADCYTEEDEANARLIAAAPDLLEEHTEWAAILGAALLLTLQGDYSEVDRLARDMRIHFPDGAPALVSSVIARAEGRDHA